MAKQKFTLEISPTFTAPVDIPVPGKGFAELKMTFKYREKGDFAAFLDGLAVDGEQKNDTELLLDIASGWDLDQPFDAEHVGQMLSRYIGSGAAILNAYIAEQTGARRKN